MLQPPKQNTWKAGKVLPVSLPTSSNLLLMSLDKWCSKSIGKNIAGNQSYAKYLVGFIHNDWSNLKFSKAFPRTWVLDLRVSERSTVNFLWIHFQEHGTGTFTAEWPGIFLWGLGNLCSKKGLMTYLVGFLQWGMGLRSVYPQPLARSRSRLRPLSRLGLLGAATIPVKKRNCWGSLLFSEWKWQMKAWSSDHASLSILPSSFMGENWLLLHSPDLHLPLVAGSPSVPNTFYRLHCSA